MPSQTITAVSGNGESLLPACESVISVRAVAVTQGIKVEARSANFPKRIMHLGWYALGTGSVGLPSSPVNGGAVVNWHYMEFERQWYSVLWSSGGCADRLIYNIDPGSTVTFTVFW